MGDQNPRDFAEKVIQSLKKSSRAVDLNEVPETEPEPKQETVTPIVSAQSNDVQAFGQPGGGGQGPGTGGNKDIVIIYKFKMYQFCFIIIKYIILFQYKKNFLMIFL